MSTCRCVLGAAALLLLFAGIARAETVTLADVDKGYYTDAGDHGSFNENYLVGRLSGSDFRNFFVFDLTDIVDQITSAKLVVNTTEVTGGGGTYELFSVETVVSELTKDGFGLTDIFDDLGEGSPYGSRGISNLEHDTDIEISLSANFLSAANSASGLFAIGGALSPLTADPQYVFGYGEPAVQLIVEIPEPGTIVLLLTGVAAMFAFTRGRRMRRA